MILVIVCASETERIAEGLRAGLGLGLRDEPVEVVLSGEAATVDADDPRLVKVLGTLAQLGRPTRVVSADELAELQSRARVIEVWGDSLPKTRQLLLVASDGFERVDLARVDNDELVRHIQAGDVIALE